MTHACCNIVLISEMKGLTRENGDRSGFLPNPIVASDQTTMNDVAASTIALARITQGLATHLYIIQSDLTDFPSACHAALPSFHSCEYTTIALHAKHCNLCNMEACNNNYRCQAFELMGAMAP